MKIRRFFHPTPADPLLRRRMLVLLALGLGLLGLALGADYAATRREAAALDEARTVARQQVRLLHHLWTDKFAQIERLHDAAARLTQAMSDGDAGATHAARDRLDGMLDLATRDEFRQVSAIGPDGRLLWSNLPLPTQPVDLSDRPHFRALRDSTRSHYISDPLLGRVSGQWTVQFSRATRDAQQRLQFVTVVSYGTDAVGAFLAALQPGQVDAFGIWHADGRPIGTSGTVSFRPDVRSRFSGRCPSPDTLVDSGLSVIDGIDRISAADCVAGSDTLVSVGLDKARWLAGAQSTARTIWRIAGIAALVAMLAAAIALRAITTGAENHERRRRQAALIAERESFYRLIDNAGVVLIRSVGADQTIEYISPGSANLFGWSADEMIGRSMLDFVHSDFQATIRQRTQDLIAGADIASFEIGMVHKTGGNLWIDIDFIYRHTAGIDAFFTVLRDATARHETKRSLNDARDQIEAINAAGPGVLCRIALRPDGTRRMTYISPAVEPVSGFSPAEAMAPGGLLDRLDPSVFTRLDAALADAKQPGRATIDFPARRRDGALRMRRVYVRRNALPDGQAEEIWYVIDITELQDAETARHVAETRLTELVMRGPAMLFQYRLLPDGQDIPLYVSPNLISSLGYPIELLARPETWAQIVDLEAAVRWSAMRRHLLETGAAQWDYAIRRADGSNMHVLASSRAERLPDGSWLQTGSMIDVTAQRHAEQALQQARADLELAVNAGPGALLRLRLAAERAPVVEYASAATQRLTGYTEADILQPGWLTRIIDPASSEALRTCQATGLAFEPCSVELRAQTHGGAWRWLQFSIQPQHRDDDASVAVIAYMMDVTQQQEQAARLQHTAKLATLGEMATSMAHELNQPLAIMSMAAENAKRDLNRPERLDAVAQRLDRIFAQAARASKLIDHLRVFGRNDETSTGPVILQHVLDGSLLLASAKLRGQGISVVTDIPGDLPPVRGNLVLLEQVVLNLLSNACDAYEGKPRTADGALRDVRIAARAENRVIRLTIADHAGGIPEAVMARVFEPFFTTKTATKGTGVGLSFSYGVVADMGGTMNVCNDDGGAVFEIALPSIASATPAAALPTQG